MLKKVLNISAIEGGIAAHGNTCSHIYCELLINKAVKESLALPLCKFLEPEVTSFMTAVFCSDDIILPLLVHIVTKVVNR